MAKITKSKYQRAVKKSDGNMTIIAQRIGVSRTALYKWLKNKPEMDELRREAENDFKDVARYSIQKDIRNGNKDMLKFYAKNQLPEYRKDKIDNHEKDIQIVVQAKTKEEEAVNRALNDEL